MSKRPRAPRATRRELLKGAGLGAGLSAAGCMAQPKDVSESRVDSLRVLPPEDAKVVPTACDYCIVGCAYEAVIWPVEESVQSAEDDVPWFSPNMLTTVEIEGRDHHVVVRPDPAASAVNPRGDHSVRGGTLAQKLYSKTRATQDRLQTPLLRVDGELRPISWEQALEIVAGTSRHVIDVHGEQAWGMKQYSYQYYENTYALTKLALGAIATPTWAVHDKPADVSDTPGLSDAGINAFGTCYQDWFDADVIFVSGVSLYDAKSVLFQQWVKPGGAKLIVVNPRRDLTAAYAEKTGGLHLQLRPGTDTVLNNAIARVIVENGWEDRDFIASRTASASELVDETSFRRTRLAMDFETYKDFLLENPDYTLARASEITGVAAEDLEAAARMMTRTDQGAQPKTSVMIEKGNYWSHNVDNTASVTSLGLVVGAGGRAGQVIGRAGGHQRGMIKGGHYPIEKSQDEFEGHKLPTNVDRYVMEGNVRFMWVVGTTWFAAMGASHALAASVQTQARQAGPLITSDKVGRGAQLDVEAVKALMRARTDDGGMVLVQQEIYANELSNYADLVLPAATWGEADFSRMQGERRLRIYSKIMDPPGEAKPDWWIAAQVGRRMGYSGFEWADENDVFEEAADASSGTAHDYKALVERARAQGQRGHEMLRSLGTTGIQCPIRVDGSGELEGTVRLHDEGFKTKSKKALFVRGDWRRVEPVQAELEPGPDQLWVLNMRVNHLWQSMADDARIPFKKRRFPGNFLEMHPDDARRRGIESGDWVQLANDATIDQLGRAHSVSVTAIAYVTDALRPGVTSGYFNYRGQLGHAINALTSGQVDPMNPVYRYKLGKARITRIGPSEFKDSMCFLPLNAV